MPNFTKLPTMRITRAARDAVAALDANFVDPDVFAGFERISRFQDLLELLKRGELVDSRRLDLLKYLVMRAVEICERAGWTITGNMFDLNNTQLSDEISEHAGNIRELVEFMTSTFRQESPADNVALDFQQISELLHSLMIAFGEVMYSVSNENANLNLLLVEVGSLFLCHHADPTDADDFVNSWDYARCRRIIRANLPEPAAFE
jgi:hypothetical protein